MTFVCYLYYVWANLKLRLRERFFSGQLPKLSFAVERKYEYTVTLKIETKTLKKV